MLPEFWKYFPERWLLSDKRRALKLIEQAAVRNICDRLMLEKLPGIVVNDPNKLRIWAEMTEKEWERHGAQVVGYFKSYGDGTLHHEFIKHLYEEYFLMQMKFKNAGSKGGHKKNHTRQRFSSPPIASPYPAPSNKVVITTSATRDAALPGASSASGYEITDAALAQSRSRLQKIHGEKS